MDCPSFAAQCQSAKLGPFLHQQASYPKQMHDLPSRDVAESLGLTASAAKMILLRGSNCESLSNQASTSARDLRIHIQPLTKTGLFSVTTKCLVRHYQ